MKMSFIVGSVLALVLVSGVSSAATHKLKGTLTTAKELPAGSVVGTAAGTADLSFDDVSRKLTGTVTFSGLHNANDSIATKAKDAFLHNGSATTAGGAFIATIADGDNITSPITVDLTLPMGGTTITDLLAGNTYINIYSLKYPGGEIRGQLVKDNSVGDAGTADAGKKDSGTTGGSDASTPPVDPPADPDPVGSSNGAVTTPVDAGGTPAAEAPAEESSGGCSTSGTEDTGGGFMLGALAGLGLAIVLRSRKKR